MKEKLETDPRYKAVESSALREELYKLYTEKQAKVKRFVVVPVMSLYRCAHTPLSRCVSITLAASDAASCWLV